MKRLGVSAALATGLVVAACAQFEPLNETLSAEYETLSAKISNWSGEPSEPLHSRMSDEDERLAAATVQDALETGLDNATRRWSNKRSGISGKVTPVKTFMTDAGVFCRDYRETVSLGDAEGSHLKTACRDEGGVWHPVD